jgi:hypothetical protein
MDTDPLHWLPGSFYRKPSWRWSRAEYLTATGRRLDPRIDDDWVDHARAALRGRGGGSTVAAVRAAQEIWAGVPAARAELEALLLTAEPLDRIVERFHIPAAVVEAYAEVFFAVRSMRPAKDWLLTRAVGYSPIRGFVGPLPASAWKLAALSGGPLLMDVVIAATTGRSLPAGFLKGTGRRRAYEDARIRSLAEIWVAAMAATTDEEFARVVKARRQLRDLDARVIGRTAWVAPHVAAMETFLVGLPAVNRKSGSAKGRSKEGEGAGGAAEAVLSAFRRLADAIATPVGTVPEARVDGSPRTGKNGSESGRSPAPPPPGYFDHEPRARRLAG